MISYDNVTLVPRELSTVDTRDNCDTSVVFSGRELDVPIIASPMKDICGGDMAFVLRRSGAMGIIHRFQTIEGQLKDFLTAISTPETSSTYPAERPKGAVGCAIGTSDDYRERYAELYNAGCRIFCIDTANGFNSKIESAVRMVQNGPDNYLIVGNVATRQGFQYLADLAVDAVRVGIAGGSVCETKVETGVYMPTLESVKECVSLAERMEESPAIIADGGIRTPADMAKALAVGADMVMGGRIFAGYRETPGAIIKDRHDGRLYKLYRGAASYGVQKDTNGEKPDYSEGAEELVPFIDKSASTVIKRFKNGFRSTLSYMNATTIKQFRQNVHVENL